MANSDPDDDLEFERLVVPTVVDFLKNILRQYPDNGQIIKELIQNAEDAEASKVEIVYHKNAYQCSQADMRLRNFLKAPAMCLYNDSEFTEDDWGGIRQMSDSIKKLDAFKIGRFGLGFKSVFHMTDYISIVSGSKVMFISPQMDIEHMCCSCKLEKLTRYFPVDHCLMLFGPYLTRRHIEDGHFPGSIFWFPLRRCASVISNTLYTNEKMSGLFTSFAAEATITLTFLKSLEKFSMETLKNGVRKTVCKVEINPETVLETRAARSKFIEELKSFESNPKDVVSNYRLTVDVLKYDVKSCQELLVLHYLTDTAELADVRTNGHLLPLVGVAAPITKNVSFAERVFCFLPLPHEEMNATGLPVHINGFFILDQNRQHIRWKTAEGLEETDVLWNETLVETNAATALFLFMKKVQEEVINGKVDFAVWYSLLPNICFLQSRWQILAKSIWKKLLHLPLIYSENKNTLLHWQDVILTNSLDKYTEDIRAAVLKVLCDSYIPIATIPEEMLNNLTHLGCSPESVTPKRVRKILAEVEDVPLQWNRMLLLRYILSDEKFEELASVPLLPLESGSWVKFHARRNKYQEGIFLCQSAEAKALLFNEKRLVAVDLNEDIQEHFKRLADQGLYQVRSFDRSIHAAALLEHTVKNIRAKRLLPCDIESWLSHVWKLLEDIPLASVAHLQLLPTDSTYTTASLVSLKKPIVLQEGGKPLPSNLIDALSLLGITLIPTLPEFVKHRDLHTNLNMSNAEGILRTLQKAISLTNERLAMTFNEKASAEVCEALLNFFAAGDTGKCLDANIKVFISKLNIFPVFNKTASGKLVSVSKCPRVVKPQCSFPVPIPHEMIRAHVGHELELACSLGARKYGKEDLCILVLDKNPSDCQILEDLVQYIFSNSDRQQSTKLREKLMTIPFVQTEAGDYKTALDLFDSRDDRASILIALNDKVPNSRYEEHLGFLRLLGLKNISKISKHELIRVANFLNDLNDITSHHVKIASTFIKLLNGTPHCRQVCKVIRTLKCIPCEETPPDSYPKNLQWFGKRLLYSPTDIKSHSCFMHVLGSVLPLVSCDAVTVLNKAFGWQHRPPVALFVQHFQNVMDSYKPNDLPYLTVVSSVYQQLDALLNEGFATELECLKSSNCILTDMGFQGAKDVYLESNEGDIIVTPFGAQLKPILLQHRELFAFLGCHSRQRGPFLSGVLTKISEIHSMDVQQKDKYLKLSINILEKMAENLKEYDTSQLIIPVESESTNVAFAPIGQCSFSTETSDWLSGYEDELGVQIVHHAVSEHIAQALGIHSLKDHMFSGEQAIMEWGQQEPLTTRLHNLLDGYRDGIAVLKELVQNADDSGATTVRFLYDERKNENAMTKLFTAKMQECQGPALWAYNDAIFSDADLLNITQLGAATKLQEKSKIGKFGLGFCSVYNITDMPSFISGSNFVLFDPHLKYLDASHTKAGVKYDLNNKRNKFMMQKLVGQFQPYQNIFSCNVQASESYPATLFRFPLRTALQATDSKISNTFYGPQQMNELLSMFMEIAGNLLIFSQNVKSIEIHRLSEASKPADIKLVFQVQRSQLYAFSGMPGCAGSSVTSTPVAKLAADQSVMLAETILTDIEVTTWNDTSLESSKTSWMVSWHSGQEAAPTGNEEKSPLLPLGSVAVPVKIVDGTYLPLELRNLPKGFYKEGHLHCFLPLPIKTTFPVHINAFFDVAHNRTSLKMPTEDERCLTDSWNAFLMTGSVCRAYLQLLKTLSTVGLSHEAPYYQLWPQRQANESFLEILLKTSFYKYLMGNSQTCKLFRDGTLTWHSMSKCYFLDNQFLAVEDIGQIALKFTESALNNGWQCVVILPPEYAKEFQVSVSFVARIIDEKVFFTKHFLPKLTSGFITNDERDIMIARVLDMQIGPVVNALRTASCIPTEPFGCLKRPKDLIHPSGHSSSMFRPEDEVFPVKLLCTDRRLKALTELGMHSTLQPDILIGRAQSVRNFSCAACAVDRSEKLLLYLARPGNSVPPQLKDVEFLPVMGKPKDWMFQWAGSNLPMKNVPCSLPQHATFPSTAFAAPKNMCIWKYRDVLGCTMYVFKCEATIPQSTLASLGIIVYKKGVPTEGVIAQLEAVSSDAASNHHSVKEVCHKIYHHLNEASTNALHLLATNNLSLELSSLTHSLHPLKERKVLLTTCGFQKPNLFADSTAAQCPPHLFCTKAEGYHLYPNLMQCFGVVPHFTPNNVLEILNGFGNSLKGQNLTQEEIGQVNSLLKLLFAEINVAKESPADYPLKEILLPDKNASLCPANTLCTEDGIPKDFSIEFNTIHPDISLSSTVASNMGILSKMKKHLQNNSKRFRRPFGQKEPLTTRLRNILEKYPFDVGIMKELLQNADDAHATTLHFIKDFRQLPTAKLFDPKWAPLQGPALCVYNDSCFSEADLENIQSLGDSKKATDPDSIGKYGIGFNAVYHLTDAPSFLTRGPDVPSGEVLCMFDPHCRYDPDATPELPGVQFDHLEELRRFAPDSFAGYLEGTVLEGKGTMLRLPLRTSNVQQSKISKKIINISQVNELIEQFIADMMKCLQFLKHVCRISVMTVSDNGEIAVEYEAKSRWDPAGLKDARELSNYMSNFSSSKTEVLTEAEPKQVTSDLKLSDSKGEVQDWIVVEQFGSHVKPPDEVVSAFKNGDLLLRPYGAVAVQLEGKLPIKQRSCTTSCFLPLPINSGLSFSINGHFALNGSRRDLWVGDDVKTMWNNWLIKEVIAPVAATAILKFREYRYGFSDMMVSQFETSVDEFHRLLPNYANATSGSWQNLVCHIFSHCIEMQIPIFDIFKTDIKNDKRGMLSWHPLMESTHNFPVYFLQEQVSSNYHYGVTNSKDNTKKLNALATILKRLGMKIGHNNMATLLKNAGIEICYITPEVVVQFLCSWDGTHPDKCNLSPKNLLVETPFQSTYEVERVLKYVSSVQNLFDAEGGLPLLITQDGRFGCFRVGAPVFLSKFYYLVPDFGNEFVHRDMLSCTENAVSKHKDANVTRVFTISDLSQRIHSVLGISYKDCDMIKLSADFEKYLTWLKQFWMFIQHSISELPLQDKESRCKIARQSLLTGLGEYALYPVHFNGEEYVMKLKNANKALHITGDENSPFRKLNVPTPTFFEVTSEYGSSSEIQQVPSSDLQLATTLADRAGVLSIIFEHKELIVEMPSANTRSDTGLLRTHFTKSDAANVLSYFGKDISLTQLSKQLLRCLPLYEDVSGNLQHINNRLVFILSDHQIPQDGLIEIGNHMKNIILKMPASTYIGDLYKYLLNSSQTSTLGIYSGCILPNFHLIPLEHYKMHLDFLRLCLYPTDPCYSAVVNLLRDVPFIVHNGKLHCARDFHDPGNEVFQTFSSSCLPKEWTAPEWHNFLVLIGMVTKVTSEMFTEFIHSLKDNDSRVLEKSKVLVKHLFNCYKEMDVKPDYFSHLEFIVPLERSDLNCIRRQFLPNAGLTSLQEAVPREHAVAVWTVAPLLPLYADPGTDKRQMFGIKNKPKDTAIIAHVANLVKPLQKSTSNHHLNILDIVYAYLSKNTSLHDELCSMPIIFIPEHGVFVKAEMTIDMLDDDIVPYLYRLPARFGKFFDFFIKLGAKEKSSCNCFASVLSMLKDKCGDKALNPEESRVMKEALRRLAKNPDDLKNLTQDLFLPTTTGELALSSELYVVDNKELMSVIRTGDVDRPVMESLETLINWDTRKFVNSLPESVRPKYISEVLEEDFFFDESAVVTSRMAERISAHLKSPAYSSRLLHLVNLFKVKGQGSLEDDEKARILLAVQSLNVKHLNSSSLKIDLLLDGRRIGKWSRQYFLKLTNGKGCLYLSSYCKEKDVSDALCDFLMKILDLGVHYETGRLLSGILNINSNEFDIAPFLDEPHKISDMESGHGMVPDNTTPGFYLDHKLLYRLNCAFCQFLEGELVAVKKYLEASDDDTYVIVQVIHRVTNGRSVMYDVYKVFNGDEEFDVEAYQLYKFLRSKQTSCSTLEKVDLPQTEFMNKTLKEILKEVKDQILSLWRDDSDAQKRRHLLIRLFLKWHLVKNEDPRATQIFKFMQSVISRLERGEPIPDDDKEREANHGSAASRAPNYWDEFSHYWNFSDNYSPSPTSATNESKTPDKKEGRRWRDQAQHDVDAAHCKNSYDGSPCWIIHMCYQAVEKIMKASVFMKDRDLGSSLCNSNGGHSLNDIAESLGIPEVTNLASEIHFRVGDYNSVRYPRVSGKIPCNRYKKIDSDYVLQKADDIFELLSSHF